MQIQYTTCPLAIMPDTVASHLRLFHIFYMRLYILASDFEFFAIFSTEISIFPADSKSGKFECSKTIRLQSISACNAHLLRPSTCAAHTHHCSAKYMHTCTQEHVLELKQLLCHTPGGTGYSMLRSERVSHQTGDSRRCFVCCACYQARWSTMNRLQRFLGCFMSAGSIFLRYRRHFVQDVVSFRKAVNKILNANLYSLHIIMTAVTQCTELRPSHTWKEEANVYFWW